MVLGLLAQTANASAGREIAAVYLVILYAVVAQSFTVEAHSMTGVATNAAPQLCRVSAKDGERGSDAFGS